jgi:hypothetical protein
LWLITMQVLGTVFTKTSASLSTFTRALISAEIFAGLTLDSEKCLIFHDLVSCFSCKYEVKA